MKRVKESLESDWATSEREEEGRIENVMHKTEYSFCSLRY